MSTDIHERWIVGLDLSARSHGALVFSAWMRRAESPAERPSLVGVHVLESWAAHYLPVGREEYVRSVRSVAERHMAEVGGAFDDVEVVEAARAEDGLAGAALMFASTMALGGVVITWFEREGELGEDEIRALYGARLREARGHFDPARARAARPATREQDLARFAARLARLEELLEAGLITPADHAATAERILAEELGDPP